MASNPAVGRPARRAAGGGGVRVARLPHNRFRSDRSDDRRRARLPSCLPARRPRHGGPGVHVGEHGGVSPSSSGSSHQDVLVAGRSAVQPRAVLALPAPARLRLARRPHRGPVAPLRRGQAYPLILFTGVLFATQILNFNELNAGSTEPEALKSLSFFLSFVLVFLLVTSTLDSVRRSRRSSVRSSSGASSWRSPRSTTRASRTTSSSISTSGFPCSSTCRARSTPPAAG